MVVNNFTHVDDLIKKIAAYPRRIRPSWERDKPHDGSSDLVFKADDGVEFSITMEDFNKYQEMRDTSNISHRSDVFSKAVLSENPIDIHDWCDGLNYGKPDFQG